MVMPQVETVVMLMLENRSLDNVLGMLYSQTPPAGVYPYGSNPKFDGVPLTAKNYHKPPIGSKKAYSPSDGCDSTHAPSIDPGEDFEHVQIQLYADADGDGTGALPKGDFWGTKAPTMTGFAWDYDSILTDTKQVMGSYNKAQLPVLYSLAENYAVSDRWFCSVPTQTYANRAFSMCGTSLGKLINKEIDGTTYANTDTIINVLAAAGKTWGVYWVDTFNSELASGAPVGIHFKPFTPYYFPRLNAAPNGGVHEFDNASQNDAFMQSLAAGTLPNFCFVEPAWGGGLTYTFSIQGDDFHPPSDVGPCDAYLGTLFNAIQASPQWKSNKMLLIITFDEHGGTYDHVPPPLTVAPDASPLSPHATNGFAFQRLGVRVPTLLVSPYVPQGLVFRSPVPDVDFDHTSFIATLCKWAGVDPVHAGLGARVAQAPTFEGVLSLTTPRTDAPTHAPAPATTRATSFSLPAVKDANGKPLTPQPIHFGDLHAAADASTSPEDFVKRLQAMVYRT